MHVVVCVRRLSNGELNPFDASSYEAALRLPDSKVTLLSMGPESVRDFLLGLTRLGASSAVLLSDPAFAGSDTLATSYVLTLAIARLSPDLIFCGRQTVDGDTGQVGPELATMLGRPLVTNVMKLEGSRVETRDGYVGEIPQGALLTMEKIYDLRLPSIRSKVGTVDVWNAVELGADIRRCGLSGSPTKVLETFQNEQDLRHCRMISKEALPEVIRASLAKPRVEIASACNGSRLSDVWIIGESPRRMAESVCDDVREITLAPPARLAAKIKAENPSVVLWGSDLESKRTAAQVAALLETGLCADCTKLETDGKILYMYRPAFSGNLIAKIKCVTRPQMATVRTVSEGACRIVVGVGYGAKEYLDEARAFASSLGAEVVASRKLVDHDYIKYEFQVGLTGKSISPDIYIALGISGAVHHIAGIKQSGTIIAINQDPNAEIFKYADYGIVGDGRFSINH